MSVMHHEIDGMHFLWRGGQYIDIYGSWRTDECAEWHMDESPWENINVYDMDGTSRIESGDVVGFIAECEEWYRINAIPVGN